VPIAEFLKLLEVELIGHFAQRVVSRLRVTHVTQAVNQPPLAICHLHPQAPVFNVIAEPRPQLGGVPGVIAYRRLASETSLLRPVLPAAD